VVAGGAGRKLSLGLPCPRPGESQATPWQPDCLEGRWGRALEPGDAEAPLSLSFRAWRKVDGHLVPPVPPGEAVQRPGEDVADRQPGKEEPKRVEDGPHRRECTPFALGLVPGRGPQGLPRTTQPTPPA
jgi:hypothetical protein